MSREVFCVSEGHRNPRHTARIYAISIILCIAKRVTENGVNSNNNSAEKKSQFIYANQNLLFHEKKLDINVKNS